MSSALTRVGVWSGIRARRGSEGFRPVKVPSTPVSRWTAPL